MSKNIILVLLYHRHKLLDLSGIFKLITSSDCPSHEMSSRERLYRAIVLKLSVMSLDYTHSLPLPERYILD
jgi:hypothetical protein